MAVSVPIHGEKFTKRGNQKPKSNVNKGERLTTIFLLDFIVIPTVWYLFVFHFIQVSTSVSVVNINVNCHVKH